MRGEDTSASMPGAMYSGSPPACAGKTFEQGRKTKLSEDHPRMRGEDREGNGQGAERAGSPPHARGRPRRL